MDQSSLCLQEMAAVEHGVRSLQTILRLEPRTGFAHSLCSSLDWDPVFFPGRTQVGDPLSSIISMQAYVCESSREESWMRRSVEIGLGPFLPSACSRFSFLSEPQEEALQTSLVPFHNPVAKAWQKATQNKEKTHSTHRTYCYPFF